MITLNEIKICDSGKTIHYNYSIEGKSKNFFNKKESYFVSYGLDVSDVPISILIIPFLVNVLPITWFLNLEIEVPEVDDSFYECLNSLKSEFQKMFPNFELEGKLNVKNIIDNSSHKACNKAMLFSGGVDAISCYVRHNKDEFRLFTVRGADISLGDSERWDDMVSYNENQNYLKANSKYYISSNLRSFYSYLLEKELGIKWWGEVQHGMALLGITAPLTYKLNIDTLYIASTHTKETQISWGSNPVTDELLTWASTKIIHECYDLSRQEKMKSIINFSTQNSIPLEIRVCYSERREELNCSSCEKCLRTIMGIILEGGNPNSFGFNANVKFYNKVFDMLKSGFSQTGIINHWKILQNRALDSDIFYVFEDINKEKKIMQRFIDLNLKMNKPKKSFLKYYRFKHALINKYPTLFQFYLKFRLKLTK